MLSYPINIQVDSNDSSLVTFPDIPEAVTSVHDESLLIAAALDALESALDFYFDDGRPIPPPSAATAGQRAVALPARLAAKVRRHDAAFRQ